jgi:hypothetical protein
MKKEEKIKQIIENNSLAFEIYKNRISMVKNIFNFYDIKMKTLETGFMGVSVAVDFEIDETGNFCDRPIMEGGNFEKCNKVLTDEIKLIKELGLENKLDFDLELLEYRNTRRLLNKMCYLARDTYELKSDSKVPKLSEENFRKFVRTAYEVDTTLQNFGILS